MKTLGRCIVAGGRAYNKPKTMAKILKAFPIEEVVSGGASGADRLAEIWANQREIPVKVFPADWDSHGRAAGPIRNREMAEYADCVVLFPGGRGTGSMLLEARRAGLLVFDFTHLSA